jgi:hypothetical protein
LNWITVEASQIKQAVRRWRATRDPELALSEKLQKSASNATIASVNGNCIVRQSDMRRPIAEKAHTAKKSGSPVSMEIEPQAGSPVRLSLLENGRVEISPRIGIANDLLLPELSAGTLGSALSPRIPQMGDLKKYLQRQD